MSCRILLTALLSAFLITPTYAVRDDGDVISSALEVEDESLNAEAGLQEEGARSNSSDEIVYVCHSFCVICNDGERAVYIRRSKSNSFWGVAAGAGAANAAFGVLSAPAVLALAGGAKLGNYIVGSWAQTLDELSNVCSAVSLVAFNPKGESAYGGQIKVDDLPAKSSASALKYMKKDMDLLRQGTDFNRVFGKAFATDYVCGNHGGVKDVEEESTLSGAWNSARSLGGSRKGKGFIETCKKAAANHAAIPSMAEITDVSNVNAGSSAEAKEDLEAELNQRAGCGCVLRHWRGKDCKVPGGMCR